MSSKPVPNGEPKQRDPHSEAGTQSVSVKEVRIAEILVEDNSRRMFDPAKLDQLAASIKRRGVIQPIIVRPNPAGKGYKFVAGERRLRAAKLAGRETIPAIIRVLTDDETQEERYVENGQREPLTPLEECDELQRMLKGRSVDEVAAITCKTRRQIHDRLILTKLTPEARALLESNNLPLHYAERVARVPAAQQHEALDACYLPLIDAKERYQRQYLGPMRTLEKWMSTHVRIDPSSEDTAVLFPELVDQIRKVEKDQRTRIFLLSTLTHHVDKQEPRPILRQHWTLAEKPDECEHVKTGVIVVGDGQRNVISVCLAKKECRKHWPSLTAKVIERAKARETKERRQQEIKEKEREAERWAKELKPQALKELAVKVQRAPLSRDLVQLVLDAILAPSDQKKALAEYVGPPAKLPKARWVQAIIMAIAIRESWASERFQPLAKRFGVTVPSPSTATGSKRRAA